MKKFLGVVVFLGLFSALMMGQDFPKAEVFGGYQYLHTGTIRINGEDLPDSSMGFNGWNTSLTGNFSKHLGLAIDFGGGYTTQDSVSTHLYTYAGGPVLQLDAGGKINPFVHALFGGIHLSGSEGGVSISENGFTMIFGGGVDARVNKAISIRVVQADWLYYHFGSDTVESVTIPSFSQSNNVRVSTGIVITF